MTTWTDSIPGKRPRVIVVAQLRVHALQKAHERGLRVGEWDYLAAQGTGEALRGRNQGHIWVVTDELSATVKHELIRLYALCPGITWEGHELLGIHKTA